MTVVVTLLAVAVGLLGLLVAGLLRSHAEILRALHDLGVDMDPSHPRQDTTVTAPRAGEGRVTDITGTDPTGAAQHVAVVDRDHSTLLAFLSSSCLTCRDFWTAFGDPRLVVPNDARVVIITRGVEAESPAAVRKLAPSTTHTVMSTEAWHAYGVPGAPYFVLVDGRRNAIVGEGTATSWDRVQQLVNQAASDDAERRDIDRDLRTAGIEPGHPSLYPDSTAERQR